MDLQLAEAARERHVLVRVQGLVAEEDDLVVVQRLAQVGHDVVGQRRGEVDPGDLRAHRRADLPGVEVSPAQRGQAVPLRRHVGERADRDGVTRQAEGAGLRLCRSVVMPVLYRTAVSQSPGMACSTDHMTSA